MERFVSVFGIDILTYAILSNQLHFVARTRPDVVRVHFFLVPAVY